MTAFAPANISLIFETYEAQPPHGRGSLGVGITLTDGVKATVGRAKETKILVGGEEWEFPTVRHVIANLTGEPVEVTLEAAFPFGCGFGMSGASALATAYALDALLKLHSTPHRLGMAAHDAEVAGATGLGDVGGQFNGGIMIKTRKFEPLTVEQLPLKASKLHVKIYGPIHTADVISSKEKLRHINQAGNEALAEIKAAGNALTLGRLFDLSEQFAVRSELLANKQVKESIAAAKAAGGHASMIMLGDAVVSTVPFPGSQSVEVHYGGARLISKG